jgi:hypothetical protein
VVAFRSNSRPFVGVVVGEIGSLLFYVSIVIGTKNAVVPNALTFDAVAFVLGFADDAFRDLIKKVTNIRPIGYESLQISDRRAPSDRPQSPTETFHVAYARRA